MKRLVMFAAAFAIAAPVYAQNVATVNGKPITQKQVDQFVSLLITQGAKDSPELREQVKQEMIGRTVAVQAAEKAGIDKQAAVKQEIELARQGILVRALMADYLKKNPITDAKIQADYEAIKKEQAGRVEYKLRHILVKDEKTAQDLLADLKAKKITFDAAAKKDSIDPGSGKNGGELGWGPTSNYVPEFAQAVESLKKGQMTDKPVQTQFGWHIIEVEDTRPIKFPTLEEVKPQITEMLRQQELGQYQQSLMKSATIK
ncbi:peptidylprolyl isomerase [Eoetvoesiella caeni]|uniref:peptidylprolyl isomerase n=1 Tax=Eoetvoesiella caeni TaxID=645616 RepID=A0A366HLP3_9BURK|nr:peptidylprolyl isomerase [Eoetvoesiella caeni]MCI2807092.1 peptidylprolyl isomerase [Eoetvoesiella caeni]NYT53511.1 peptidylprolyl isomerase [Eoetvoesiella caeni]RBP43497.1 peptidyl-prolyl cis-trans isomerase C [Eoetvoesiella caeni]